LLPISSRNHTGSSLAPPHGPQRGRALVLVTIGIALCAALVAGWQLLNRPGPSEPPRHVLTTRAEELRRHLFDELQPVRLANCELERFGEPHDGGYLMCGNLLDAVTAGYSYGISGYDGWGCDISRRAGVPVHQYDCFDTTRPVCEGGTTIFHAECVAGQSFTDPDGRIFDTVENQLARTGSGTSRVVLKMDVEGAEWDSLMQTPDDVLRRVDQIAIEFHGADEDRFLLLVWKLKQFFHVAHLHFNNFACVDHLSPFPAWAYEVLFVNKDLATVAPGQPTLPHPLDAPNNPEIPDCPALPRLPG
jgi:hypothetical protein